MCFGQYEKNDVNLGEGPETLEALTRVDVMVRYVRCSHPGSKSLSVRVRSHLGLRTDLTQSAPIMILCQMCFPNKPKKTN